MPIIEDVEGALKHLGPVLDSYTQPRVAILTGAGISAESGIATFRAQNGLWEQHRIEDVATPEGFKLNPDLVYEFYNMRRMGLKSVEPNEAHKSLAAWERRLGKRLLVVTQNVDDLHERAGSLNLIHMHGELRKVRCEDCHSVHTWIEDLDGSHVCEHCQTGRMRPHIVWFGELPFEMDTIQSNLFACDIFISIGTSGNVYPAAGFAELAKSSGSLTLEINIENTGGMFDFHCIGKASNWLPRLAEWIV